MAPHVPEEVDVFTIPHSRMKELVNDYAEMIKKTNFRDDTDLKLLLESLLRTFMEFKCHEQIENQLIMKKLKNKLKQLSIQNAAVCNCHNDDDLGRMMNFIKAGYRKKTVQDRVNFGLKLVKALEDFTESFIPHMQEEEEVFQPMLLQYFAYDELCDLKKKVIQQHITKEQQLLLEQAVLFNQNLDNKCKGSETEKTEANGDRATYCEAFVSAKQRSNEENKGVQDHCSIEHLPPELKLRILSYLNPPDLCHMSAVSSGWKQLCRDPQLWPELYPVSWAKGNWVTHVADTDENGEDDFEDLNDEIIHMEDSAAYTELDLDADIDETVPDIVKQVKRESEILLGLVKYILPTAGTGTKKLVLKNSRALTNSTLNKIIQHCPNLEYLDLTQTRTSDAGLKRIGKNGCGSKLKQVILSGCVNITDATLLRLAVAQHQSLNASKMTLDNDSDQGMCGYSNNIFDENYLSKAKMKRRILGKVEPAKIEVSCCVDGGMCCKNEFKQESENSDFVCGIEPKEDVGGKGRKDYCNMQTSTGSCCKAQDFSLNEVSNDPVENHPVGSEDDGNYDLDCLCEMYYRECNIFIDDVCEIRTHHCRKEVSATGHSEISGFHDPSDGKNPFNAGCKDMTERPPLHVDLHVEGKQNIGKDETAGIWGEKANPFQEECVETKEIRVKETCGHKYCVETNEGLHVSAIEECVPVTSKTWSSGGIGEHPMQTEMAIFGLEHLNFSGCFQITDVGLRALGHIGRYPYLHHLDLSGCLRISGDGLHSLVDVCPNLEPASLYYCDNIVDGPHADLASGCQNLECGNRVCCRSGQ